MISAVESDERSLAWCLAAAVVVSLVEVSFESLLWWAYHRTLTGSIHRQLGVDSQPRLDGDKSVSPQDRRGKPLSVNYHFTRQCNYQCGFCFHTAKTSFVLPIEEAKRGLLLLKEAG